MKKNTLKIVSLLLSFLVLLSACGPAATAAPSVAPTETVAPSPTIEPTPIPTPSPEPELVKLSKREELRSYLIEQYDAGNLEISFEFSGNSNLLEPQTLAQFLATFSVSVERDSENRKVYTVTVIEFPGDRIVDAYFSGDTSLLNADELQVLDIAKQIINELAVDFNDLVALEKAVHDAVCDRVELSNNADETDDPLNPPRQMTVIGAFLDGSATSCGYSDAFYTVASMVGLDVDRMYIMTDATEYKMVNTIHLDGNWYIVDVTYNDNEAADSVYKPLFNSGLDADAIYDWSDAAEKRVLSYCRYDERDIVQSEIPSFTSLVEVRDFINGRLEDGIYLSAFKYTGSSLDLTDSFVGHITGENVAVVRSKSGIYYSYILVRSGSRIVDAYFSGDTSFLSNDEINALEVAAQMVKIATSKSSTQLELEKELHDALVAHMSYYDGDSPVDIYGIPRKTTAVGALLDRKGNCLAYADAFYALAAMAGMNVGKMVVDTSIPLNHICNTVNIDGNWYIVDVTVNDPDWANSDLAVYTHYNIGADQKSEVYSWQEIMEYHPIAEISNPAYLIN